MASHSQVLLDVLEERERQEAKWGQQDHDDGRWSLVLAEEVGEVGKAALEGDRSALVDELVQVAAVAVAWIEAIHRRP